MSEGVSKEYCTEHGKVIDERFARDKEDLESHRTSIEEITKLTAEIGQLVKQHEAKIDNHESRIDILEHKPSVWFDRIISGIVAAVIAAVVGAIMSGGLKL